MYPYSLLIRDASYITISFVSNVFAGPMLREIKKGSLRHPNNLPDIPVSLQKSYKSVKWWPELPQEGKIFWKADKKELSSNFKEQLGQVWQVCVTTRSSVAGTCEN
jgi:hypothetical protein